MARDSTHVVISKLSRMRERHVGCLILTDMWMAGKIISLMMMTSLLVHHAQNRDVMTDTYVAPKSQSGNYRKRGPASN